MKRKREGRYPYPLLECNHHPGPQRSYIVCIHVMAGASAANVEMATGESSGLALCFLCRKQPNSSAARKAWMKRLRPICEGCAIELGFLISP